MSEKNSQQGNESNDNRVHQVWSVISHDLKTPLAILSGELEHLEVDLLPVLLDAYEKAQAAGLAVTPIRPDRLKNYKKALPLAQLMLDRVSQYIERLDCKLQPPPLNASIEAVTIADCVQQSLADFKPRYAISKDRNCVTTTLESAEVAGNTRLITVMIYELLANAEYAMAEVSSASHCPSVILSGEKTDEYYYLEIKNNGRLIANSDIPHLFEPYFATHHGSMGMGLAFCKQAMKAMGGKITCSTREDAYNVFTLVFRLK